MTSTLDTLAILGVLVLMFAVVESNVCDSAPRVDGCSIPWGLSFWYKKVFESDCNKHDLCYTCGSYLNVNRDECDKRFLSNMKRTCKTSEDVKYRSWCKYVARLYYYGVKWFGEVKYEDESPSFCSEDWVPGCIQ